MAEPTQKFVWNFRRLGGLDQVILDSGEDLCHLHSLDPKLWVALSCPSWGLEFDDRTLALIDTDKDGRVRVPEVVEAVTWICARLKNPASMVDAPDLLPFSAINTATPDGRRLVATGRAVLASLGKEGAPGMTQEDVVHAAAHMNSHLFNGDGILPPSSELEPEVCRYISDALDVMGGMRDAGGQPGIDRDISRAFMKTLRDFQFWRESVTQAASPLGSDTAEAWDLVQTLRGKIEDYFLRCELAAYAPRIQPALNADETALAPEKGGRLTLSGLAELPLSQAAADRPLNLTTGLNPAWRSKVERFAALVRPLLDTAGQLSRDEWKRLLDHFAPYSQVLAHKPAPVRVETDTEPSRSVEQLGDARIKELLGGRAAEQFEALAEEDAKVPAGAADIAAVERLVLYHRHLYRLLMNFVSFTEFYEQDRPAAFQAGVLYLDGRSCHLCVPVEDIESHAVLATFSQLYLVYCECRRAREKTAPVVDGTPPETKIIAAAVTTGDSDLLVENRNGVFVDNDGEDWDATVVRIISNPISLRQAVWSPYKRVGRLISQQVEKFASSKNTELFATASQKLEQLNAAAQQNAVSAQKFDISRNVGIFAALGLAVGAIGTALATIARSLLSLQWWQFPLLFLGIFLLISGPSVIMAWMKLRQRTLGPLLEASGWAINGRVDITYSLARQLTDHAELPENATRTFLDPLQKKRGWPKLVFFGCAALGAALVIGWLWLRGHDYRPLSRFIRPPAMEQSVTPVSPETPPVAPAGAVSVETAAKATGTAEDTTAPAPQRGAPSAP